MTTISTPTRLHFGLLHVPAGGEGRRFGGCGLMLAAPRVTVSLARSDAWSTTGPESGRALEFARRVGAGLGFGGALSLRVESCPPGHTGLGVGTALGMAVARGMAAIVGRSETAVEELAALAGRGERSAIGARGAGVGGFLVDGGRGPAGRLGPLIARYEFPDWPIVLSRPPLLAAWHGQAERAAFDRPRDKTISTRVAERMTHALLLGVMPAILERDYSAFGAAISDYNRLAGEAFAADQGGIYASPSIEKLITIARQAGGVAAGQSSWGPTVFAICSNVDNARLVAQHMAEYNSGTEVTITSADNFGAALSEHADQPDQEHVGGEDE